VLLTEIFGSIARSAEFCLPLIAGIEVGIAAFVHGFEDRIGIILFEIILFGVI